MAGKKRKRPDRASNDAETREWNALQERIAELQKQEAKAKNQPTIDGDGTLSACSSSAHSFREVHALFSLSAAGDSGTTVLPCAEA